MTDNDHHSNSYVYRSFEPGLWTVGFYGGSGKWYPESDCARQEEAAQRVAWLNGGGHADRLETRISRVENWIHDHEMTVPHAESQA